MASANTSPQCFTHSEKTGSISGLEVIIEFNMDCRKDTHTELVEQVGAQKQFS